MVNVFFCGLIISAWRKNQWILTWWCKIKTFHYNIMFFDQLSILKRHIHKHSVLKHDIVSLGFVLILHSFSFMLKECSCSGTFSFFSHLSAWWTKNINNEIYKAVNSRRHVRKLEWRDTRYGWRKKEKRSIELIGWTVNKRKKKASGFH